MVRQFYNIQLDLFFLNFIFISGGFGQGGSGGGGGSGTPGRPGTPGISSYYSQISEY
jgi:hypothetical protein